MPQASGDGSGAVGGDVSCDRPFRSGLVALCGRPNVGKSTLLNRLVGQTVAIVTPVAQTTRRRIRGVIHGRDYQVVLLDTPGLFLETSGRRSALHRRMTAEALAALHECDLVLLLLEAGGRGSRPGQDAEDTAVLEALRAAGRPALLVINKIDRLADTQPLERLQAPYLASGLFSAVLPISALRGKGLRQLLEAIVKHLPGGPPFFPPDMVTDESERNLAAELIRQQVILQTGEEIPFRTAVEIVAFREGGEKKATLISAVIHTERESQKGILIGRGGRRLKSIGVAARRNIEKLLGVKVYLDLRVKVSPGWYKTDAGLRRTGQVFA